MIKDKLFVLKVWLSTIISGSVLFAIYDTLQSLSHINELLEQSLVLVLINALIGLPGLLVYYVVFLWINNSARTATMLKVRLIASGFLIFLITWSAPNLLYGRNSFFTTKSIFIYSDFLICIIAVTCILGKTEKASVIKKE